MDAQFLKTAALLLLLGGAGIAANAGSDYALWHVAGADCPLPGDPATAIADIHGLATACPSGEQTLARADLPARGAAGAR
jgi:hypothetical protein